MKQTVKTNTFALISFCCGLLVLVSLVLYWFLYLVPVRLPPRIPMVVIDRLHQEIMDFSVTIRNYSALVAVITAILAFGEIKKKDGAEKGRFFAWIGLILGIVWIIIGVFISGVFMLARYMN